MLSLQDLNVFCGSNLFSVFDLSTVLPVQKNFHNFNFSNRFGEVEAMLAKKQKEQQDLVNDKSPKVEGAPRISDVY